MKRALITGAGNGIGAATARKLAQRGWSLALIDLDPGAAERVAAECGPAAYAFAADITDGEQITAAVEAGVEALGGLDVCFANAGIATVGVMRHLDPEVFAVQVDVNLIGAFRTVHACLPQLIADRGYLAINASASALVAPPGLGAYGATKAAVESMGDTLRLELEPHGVDVGVVYLLWIATDMVQGAERSGDTFATIRSSMAGPLKNAISAEQAADAIVRGIERRSRRVVAPRLVGALYRVRGLFPGLLERDMRKAAAEIEAASVRDMAGGDGIDGAVRDDTPAQVAAAAAVRERRS